MPGTLSGLDIAENANFFQRGYGSCEALSTMKAILRFEAGDEYLESLIQPNADGSYTVTFPWIPESPINVTINEANDVRAVNASLPIRILERAYIEVHEQHIPLPPDTSTLALFTGVHHNMAFDPSDSAALNDVITNSESLVLFASIGENPKSGYYLRNVDGFDLVGEHAYTFNVVTENGQMYLEAINPWYTDRTLRLTPQEFADTFDMVYTVPANDVGLGALHIVERVSNAQELEEQHLLIEENPVDENIDIDHTGLSDNALSRLEQLLSAQEIYYTTGEHLENGTLPPEPEIVTSVETDEPVPAEPSMPEPEITIPPGPESAAELPSESEAEAEAEQVVPVNIEAILEAVALFESKDANQNGQFDYGSLAGKTISEVWELAANDPNTTLSALGMNEEDRQTIQEATVALTELGLDIHSFAESINIDQANLQITPNQVNQALNTFER